MAFPAQGGPDKSERRGRELTPCTVQRLAEKAHAQRRGLRRQRGAARHVGHVQRAGTQAHEESQDDGCQVVFTDAEEIEDADAALVMPGRETDVAALGTGEGGVALPKAFPNADLIAMQAKDPDWLRYMQLVNKPRAQWPPHLAAAPLQFLYVAGVLSCESTVSSAWDPARTTRRPDGSETQAQSTFLGRPRIVLPADVRPRAMHAHQLSYYGGHFGLATTFARVVLRYWWPRQRANIRAFLARCTFCIANTQFSRPWRWLSLPIGTPFETVAADTFDPLKPTARGHTHILVLIDPHTRLVERIALPAWSPRPFSSNGYRAGER